MRHSILNISCSAKSIPNDFLTSLFKHNFGDELNKVGNYVEQALPARLLGQ